MSDEKKFNNEMLYVLKQIKSKSLYALKGQQIEYWVSFVADENVIPPQNEANIIKKLEELGAITIWREFNSPSDIFVEYNVFGVEIKQPKFDELYAKLNEPYFKKERYNSYSADSLRKIISVLDCLKEEWDLATKESADNNSCFIEISQRRYFEWVRSCELNDFYQLKNILETLKQEGVLEKAFLVNPAV